jgi:hypothetical protein
MQSQSAMLFSQAALQGGASPHARDPTPTGKYLDEAESGNQSQGLPRSVIAVDKANVLHVQELQHKVRALRAQAASQEWCLRESLASLASQQEQGSASAEFVGHGGVGGDQDAANHDAHDQSKVEDDDVYSCDQPESTGGAGEEDAGRETDDGDGAAEDAPRCSDAASTAAAVSAVASRWAELKSRCAVISDDIGEKSRDEDYDPFGEDGEEEGTPSHADTALARSETRNEAEQVESGGISCSSLTSSLSTSLGSKSRGGRLGLLTTSLDASAHLQLPETPHISAGPQRQVTSEESIGDGIDEDCSVGPTDGASSLESSAASSLASSSSGRRTLRKGRLALLEVGSTQ